MKGATRLQAWALALTVALILGLAAISITSSQRARGYETHCEEKDTADKDCSTNNVARVALWEIAKALETHNGAVTAAASIVVAVFTGTLWWVTRGLFIIAKRQTRILDQTLVQTNKAFVCTDSIIHSIVGIGGKIEGWNFYFTVKNTGNTPTKKLSLCTVLLVPANGSEIRQEYSQGGMIGPRTNYLAPLHFINIDTMHRVRAEEVELFLAGCCRYQTVFSNDWEITEFCYGIAPLDDPMHPQCRFRFFAVEGKNRAYQTSDGEGACPPLPT